MQMIGAGRIEDDPVGQIGGDDRGVALQDPEREAVERLSVGRGRGVLYEETGDEDLSLGGGHPDAQAGGLGRNVRRDHYPPSPVRSEEHTSELQSLMRISYDVCCF